ncbi:MAG: AgmX/PglI C-terminal domain-containing protein, partial [Polyangiales bacterium]
KVGRVTPQGRRMQEQTLELLRVLQLSERDAGTFGQIQARLPTERARLTSADDRSALADISELLEVWAETAPPELAAAATVEAAQIADEDLEQAERAVTLYALALQRAPTALDPLKKLDALLCRRGERERLEAALEKHVDAMRTAPDVDPLSIAFALRRLGQLRAERSTDLGPAIDAYERALDLAAEPEAISELAGLYARRGSNGDAAQAAELYSTLGEALGAEQGVPMLERALDLAPGHDAALDVLETYVPAAEQPARLRARWAAYVDSSENEAGVDRRRLLLARAHAGLGRYRDALICLGPLIDKSDAEALRLQAACLSSLQETKAADAEDGAAVRPPTLVGFRVPAPDDEPSAAEPEAARAERTSGEANAIMVQGAAAPKESRAAEQPLAAVAIAPTSRAAKPEAAAPRVSAAPAPAVAAPKEPAPKAPVSERRASGTGTRTFPPAQRPASTAGAKSEPQPQRAPAASSAERARAVEAAPTVKAGAEAKKPQSEVRLTRARAARSGHTLVGFRIPTEGDDAAARELSGEPPPPVAEQRPTNGSSATRSRDAASRPAKQLAPAAKGPSPRASQAPAARAAELKAASLRVSRAPSVAAAAQPAPAPAAPAALPIRRSVPPRLPSRAPAAPSVASVTSAEPSAAVLAAAETAYAESALQIEAAAPIAHSAPPAFAAAAPAPFEPEPRESSGNKRMIIIAAGVAVLVAAVFVVALRNKPSPVSAPSHGDAVAPQPAAIATAPVAPAAPPPAEALAPAVAPTPPEPPKLAIAPEPEKKPVKADAQPTLKAGRAHVVGGGLTAQQIALGLEDALPVIEHCYATALKHHPQLQGRIVFGWTVGKTGQPSKVRKLTATLDDAKLLQCSLEPLRKAHFAKPKKKTSDITWPLEFKKS